MDIGYENIINFALFLIVTYAGVSYFRAKNFAKELIELLSAVSDAIQDDTVTDEEVQRIVDEVVDVANTLRKK